MAIFDSAESSRGDILNEKNVTFFDKLAPEDSPWECWLASLDLIDTREPRISKLSEEGLRRPGHTGEVSWLSSESVLSSPPLSNLDGPLCDDSSPGPSRSSTLLPSSSCPSKLGDGLYLFCGSSCLRKRPSIVGALRFEAIISWSESKHGVMT